MPFFKPETISPQSKVTPKDVKRARKLCQIIYSTGRITCRPNLTKWTVDIRLCLKDINYEEERLDKVLEWLNDHAKDPYTPHIYSAQSFRTKFCQIEDAMNRQVSGYKRPIITHITREAHRIAENLQNFRWPKDFNDKLPLAVQMSLDSYQIVWEELDKIHHYSGSKKDLVRSLQEYMMGASNFLLDWFQRQFNRVADWNEWSANPMSIAFSEESTLFHQMFLGWVREYTSDRSIGIILLEELRCESRKSRRKRGTTDFNRNGDKQPGPRKNRS